MDDEEDIGGEVETAPYSTEHPEDDTVPKVLAMYGRDGEAAPAPAVPTVPSDPIAPSSTPVNLDADDPVAADINAQATPAAPTPKLSDDDPMVPQFAAQTAQVSPISMAPQSRPMSPGSRRVTTEYRTTPSPQETEARARAGQIEIEELANARSLGNIDRKRAEIEAAQAQEKIQAEQAAEERRNAIKAEAEKKIAAAEAARKQAYDAWANMPEENYWDNKSTGQRIGAKLAIVLGMFGSALTGQRNMALDVINADIEQDMAAKRAKRERLLKAAQMTDGAVSDAFKAKADALADDETMRAASLAKVKAKTEQMLAAAGVPAAEIKSNATVLQLEQERQDAMAKAAEGLRTKTITQTIERAGGAGGSGSGGQSAKAKLAEEKAQMARERFEMDKKKLAIQEQTNARAAIGQVFEKLGYSESRIINSRFNRLAKQLGESSAALDAMSAGEFVKQAQGGTGVISNSDMDIFWLRIGGAKEKTWQWIENVLSGKISQDKRADVEKAVRWLSNYAGEKLNDIQKAAEYHFNSSDTLRPLAQQFIGTYFEAARGRAPSASAAKPTVASVAKSAAPSAAPAKAGGASTPMPPAKSSSALPDGVPAGSVRGKIKGKVVYKAPDGKLYFEE